MKSCKYTDYTYLEIKDFIDKGCLAILPTGCTDQQGPHLPVDFDTWFAETIALAMVQIRYRSLLACPELNTLITQGSLYQKI